MFKGLGEASAMLVTNGSATFAPDAALATGGAATAASRGHCAMAMKIVPDDFPAVYDLEGRQAV